MKNKVAIVTGASSGIGRAIAKKLSDEGMHLALVARNEKKLSEVAQELKGEALIIPTDIAQEDQVEAMYQAVKKAFGQVNVLVNNAGVMLSAAVSDGAVSDWEAMIDTNIKGTLYGLHQVLPEMTERGSGHIVNTASVSAFEVSKKSAVYSATKFAIRAIAMGLEKELAHSGVRVTNISPGMVDTPLASRAKQTRKPLDAENIADAVFYAISQPDHVNVNEITVRPV